LSFSVFNSPNIVAKVCVFASQFQQQHSKTRQYTVEEIITMPSSDIHIMPSKADVFGNPLHDFDIWDDNDNAFGFSGKDFCGDDFTVSTASTEGLSSLDQLSGPRESDSLTESPKTPERKRSRRPKKLSSRRGLGKSENGELTDFIESTKSGESNDDAAETPRRHERGSSRKAMVDAIKTGSRRRPHIDTPAVEKESSVCELLTDATAPGKVEKKSMGRGVPLGAKHMPNLKPQDKDGNPVDRRSNFTRSHSMVLERREPVHGSRAPTTMSMSRKFDGQNGLATNSRISPLAKSASFRLKRDSGDVQSIGALSARASKTDKDVGSPALKSTSLMVKGEQTRSPYLRGTSLQVKGERSLPPRSSSSVVKGTSTRRTHRKMDSLGVVSEHGSNTDSNAPRRNLSRSSSMKARRRPTKDN
jgi:hypothetical protein